MAICSCQQSNGVQTKIELSTDISSALLVAVQTAAILAEACWTYQYIPASVDLSSRSAGICNVAGH